MIEAWDCWRVPLSNALDQRYYDLPWLEWLVMSGRARFLANESAAAIAEIIYYPTGARDLKGVCAAGDVHEIVNVLIPELIEWGKSMGCIAAQIESREAWSRLLRKQGFELYKTSVRRAL
jgi:hypothetical protein